MKKFVSGLSLFLLILIGSSAWAAGLGVYGTAGLSFQEWKYKEYTGPTTSDYNYGGGIIIESVSAGDRLFGYRFTAGYEKYVLKVPVMLSQYNYNMGYPIDCFHRFSMSHTFGFGIIRNETVRFWFGPQVGLHYLYSRANDHNNKIHASLFSYGLYLYNDRFSYNGICLDLLLALGVNINLGGCTTLFAELGFGYMGNYDLDNARIANGLGFQSKLGIMFRINDQFAAEHAVPAADVKK